MKNLILACFTILFLTTQANGQDISEPITESKLSWRLANGKIEKIPAFKPQIVFPQSLNKQSTSDIEILDAQQARLEKAIKEYLESSSNQSEWSSTKKFKANPTTTPNVDENRNYPYNIELYQPDGTTISSAEVLKKNGKPTVLLFGTTFCGPCIAEKEAIQTKYDDWKKEIDFNLVSISMNPEALIGNFIRMAENKNYPWKSYNDTYREFESVIPNLKGFPVTIVLDKNGKIIYQKSKYEAGDEDILFEKIQEVK